LTEKEVMFAKERARISNERTIQGNSTRDELRANEEAQAAAAEAEARGLKEQKRILSERFTLIKKLTTEELKAIADKEKAIKDDFKRWSDYWDKTDALEVKRNEEKNKEIKKDFERWSDYWDKRDAFEADRSKRNIEAGFEFQKLKARDNLNLLEIILDDEYKALTQSVEYQRLTNNEKLLADQQYTESLRELSFMRNDQRMMEYQIISNTLGNISALRQSFASDEINEIKANADIRKDQLKNEYDQKIISKIQLEKAIRAIDNEANKAIAKQAGKGKALAVAESLISTYTAGVKAMAELPLGSGPFLRFLTLASVITAGLLQVKKILAVKVPGDTGGGAPTAISTSMPAMRLYASPAGATFLTQPQLTQPQINALPNQGILTAADIAAAISKLPHPIVTVEDINAKTASVRKVEVRGNI